MIIVAHRGSRRSFSVRSRTLWMVMRESRVRVLGCSKVSIGQGLRKICRTGCGPHESRLTPPGPRFFGQWGVPAPRGQHFRRPGQATPKPSPPHGPNLPGLTPGQRPPNRSGELRGEFGGVGAPRGVERITKRPNRSTRSSEAQRLERFRSNSRPVS